MTLLFNMPGGIELIVLIIVVALLGSIIFFRKKVR